MKTFKQYFIIKESASFVLSRYSVFWETLSEKKQKRVKDALANLKNALSSGQIYNPEYQEIKSALSLSLESTLENIQDLGKEDSEEFIKTIHANWDISTYVQLNQTGKQIKVLEKAINTSKDSTVIDYLNRMLEVNKLASELKTALDSLKDKVIKGRKPSDKPIDPNKFQQKLGGSEAQSLIKDLITKSIIGPLDEYENRVKEYLQSEINDILKAGSYSYERGKANPFRVYLLLQCFDFDKNYNQNVFTYENLKLTQSGKEFPAKDAKERRDAIEQKFLAKSIGKLSHIVELKGNLKEMKELPMKPVEIRSGSGIIEAGFEFIFADGSSFKVVNKIVTKYTFSGKPFVQYPTTFHDVKFPDGSKMKSPSEEKMVKEFANKISEGINLLALQEAVYSGNVGVMELLKFYKIAPPDLVSNVKGLIASKQNKEAWEIIQDFLGVRLSKSGIA